MNKMYVAGIILSIAVMALMAFFYLNRGQVGGAERRYEEEGGQTLGKTGTYNFLRFMTTKFDDTALKTAKALMKRYQSSLKINLTKQKFIDFLKRRLKNTQKRAVYGSLMGSLKNDSSVTPVYDVLNEIYDSRTL
uniref:Uncharacterized protein n=1 Tax=viral metagenome TaxID=1070528 RepID=A0A6C0J802_9ZZZZ